MFPELVRIGPFVIYSFGFMMAMGFLVGAYLLRREFQRVGEDPDLAYEIITAAAIGGIVGAKVYYLLDNWKFTASDPWGMIFSGSGLVWYGGLIGGTVGVVWWLRRRRKAIGRMCNTIIPHLALGQAFGRLGCFLVGDDYGVPSSLPWAVAFPKGVPPTLDTVHPTQIYEATLLLGIFLVLRSQMRREIPGWSLVYGYCVLAGMQRFFVEFIRTNEVAAAGMTLAQLISIALIVIGAAGLFQLRRNLRVPQPALETR